MPTTTFSGGVQFPLSGPVPGVSATQPLGRLTVSEAGVGMHIGGAVWSRLAGLLATPTTPASERPKAWSARYETLSHVRTHGHLIVFFQDARAAAVFQHSRTAVVQDVVAALRSHGLDVEQTASLASYFYGWNSQAQVRGNAADLVDSAHVRRSGRPCVDRV